MRQPCLERLHVGVEGVERQPRQISEMVRADGRAEPVVTEARELLPMRLPGVALQDVVPLLGSAMEVVRSEPNPVHRTGLLGAEELFTLVQPPQGILRAVIGRKGEFVVFVNGVTLGVWGNVGSRRW